MKKPPFSGQLSPGGRDILDLTLKMVKIRSVCGTTGVRKMGLFIHNWLKKLSYFKKNPHYLQRIMLPGDEPGRFNIIALIRGTGDMNADTVVYLGHMDTVDTEEYGDLEKIATDPLALSSELRNREMSLEEKEDICSDDWLWGRGTADMKSGLAVFMKLFAEYAKNTDELRGNILLAITVNEEADSLGMLSLAGSLVDLAAEEKLNYVGAINADYTTGKREDKPGDRYIYSGSIGKIMPAVYAVGRSSHVGEVFAGFDVNMLLSELTLNIDNNMELSDRYQDLITDPPVSLKQMDLKDIYSGQLPHEGFAYYNFLNYRRESSEIIKLMREIIEDSFNSCQQRIDEQYRQYCYYRGEEYQGLEFEEKIFSYGELHELVSGRIGKKKLKASLDKIINGIADQETLDLRLLSLKLVRKLWHLSGQDGPAVVILLVPPYYPPHPAHYDDPAFINFNNQIRRSITRIQGFDGYNYKLQPFFPYISDASFCAYTGDKKEEENLVKNMPCWNRGWEIDLINVKKLNLPVANIGVFGRGAHEKGERVHMPYTFETLPKVIKEVTADLLKV